MKKVEYICDICGKKIKEGHQELYMVKIKISGTEYKYDDGTNDWEEIYYVHNDLNNHCIRKILEILKKE